jgi:predicted HAD superfamily Cof-like phosphohydrolase
MSRDWVADINRMHRYYGFHRAVNGLDDPTLLEMLRFRINFLREELNELDEAVEPEDVVDALIDLCVVAIGTLDLYNVDAYAAWDEVHMANMAKEVGIKESRPNPLGLPDLVKPSGWLPPSHQGNHGKLTAAMAKKGLQDG